MDKKVCPWCEVEFVPNHARRKFCCDSHRIMAHNKKKGYKVALVPQEERKPTTNESSPKRTKAAEDFNAGSVGAATVGTMAGNKLYDVLTSDNNKPASKGYVKQAINDLYNTISRDNQRRHKELLDRLGNKNNSFADYM